MSLSSTVSTAKDSYNEWHGHHDVDSAADTPWHGLLRARLQIERDLAGKQVLEIACGRGGLACRLVQESAPAPHLVAADFSRTAVTKGRAFANGRSLSSLRWEVADAQSLPHPDNSFDTIISCETIEHLPRPRTALAEFHRVLKPGGRLFLTTPNYLGPLGLYRGYLRLVGRRYTEEGQPINRFLLAPLTRAWVQRTGLRVVGVDTTGLYLPWPRREPIRLRTLERWRALRWFGLHTLVVAVKPL